MQRTIRLQVSDKIYDRLIRSLEILKGDDLTIIDEDESFLRNREEVRSDYSLVKEDKATYLNFDEFERRLMAND